ncbi:hypothetical protein [Paenibacillus xylaniclasticus]|uniref:hypothetical protein n=1 Tax=Paenibacillus xylaniclasticus TaxID=588083 RepID=UPI000FDBD2B1|nr:MULTISPECIES: hypothetical protein [Paenibacillus]GFN32376.1 hypothetical protein PCURB6_26360 [Paenibacillus curdlanolyticus]
MSRSWERKVRNNMKQLNKQRKKQGLQSVVPSAEKTDTYKGRSYIGPFLVVMLTAMYTIVISSSSEPIASINWVTIGLYLFLALMLFMRRPHIKVGTNYIQTRKFTGLKTLQASDIKAINVSKGYVVIERHRGGNWVFSQFVNRYPTDQIAERMQAFAKQHQLPFNNK